CPAGSPRLLYRIDVFATLTTLCDGQIALGQGISAMRNLVGPHTPLSDDLTALLKNSQGVPQPSFAEIRLSQTAARPGQHRVVRNTPKHFCGALERRHRLVQLPGAEPRKTQANQSPRLYFMVGSVLADSDHLESFLHRTAQISPVDTHLDNREGRRSPSAQVTCVPIRYR